MDRPEGNQFYQLILDGGVCQGRRIVSESVIAEMTRPHTTGWEARTTALVDAPIPSPMN